MTPPTLLESSVFTGLCAEIVILGLATSEWTKPHPRAWRVIMGSWLAVVGLAATVFFGGCAKMTLETPDGCGRLTVNSTTLFGNETGTVTSGTWTVASEAGGQNAGPLIASILSGLASAGVIAAANPAPMALRAVPPHPQVVCGSQVIPTPVPSP